MKISNIQDLIPSSTKSNSAVTSRQDALEKFNSFNPAGLKELNFSKASCLEVTALFDLVDEGMRS